eukprot:TRINITY_DN41054_c0_g1_i1.p1 TRINITY_DN41054_c0_g1~~TRINITY_DN41054_c0_g1_i1.p1  ORF type:complete len:544 (-),score=86.98 TRINITY_DN41054_c0_g1_i1:42-1673(-)
MATAAPSAEVYSAFKKEWEGAEGLDTEEAKQLPITHEGLLKGHQKACCAVGLDMTGTRLATAGWEGLVKLWDFAGMTSSLQSFREVDPLGDDLGQYVMNQIAWSNGGDMFILARAHPQPVIYNREGKELVEFARGDVYVTDMANTKGHTAEITVCQWCPNDRTTILTGGKDSTLRLWDVEYVNKKQATVIKTSQGVARWRRAPVTSGGYSPDGCAIIAGADDGSIFTWPEKGPFGRPALHIKNAHTNNTPITGISMNTARTMIVSRGGPCDESVKMWDVRNTRAPLFVERGLESTFDLTEVVFSPDEKTFVTGTSAKRGEGKGNLVFWSTSTFKKVATVPVTDGSVIRLSWHRKLNQILVCAADSAVHVLFDPTLSRDGALLCCKKVKKYDPADAVLPSGEVYLPNSLKGMKEEMWKEINKRKRDLYLPDKSGLPRKYKHESDIPSLERAPSSAHQMWKEMGMTRNSIRDDDPVEKLRQYAREAQDNPFYVDLAYKKNQPNPIFADPEDPDEVDPSDPLAGDIEAKKRRILTELKDGRNRRMA